MTKSLTETTGLSSPPTRKKLEAGVYYSAIISKVLHLGYRKDGRPRGVWLVRWRNGAGYKYVTLGPADDLGDRGEGEPDGRPPLSYAEALNRAQQTWQRHIEDEKAKALAGEVQATEPPWTVQYAVEEYVDWRDTRDSEASKQVRSDARQRLGRYVTGAAGRGKREAIPASTLASVALVDLSKSHLVAWVGGLPEHFKHATKDRLVGDLKAALNFACEKDSERETPRLPDTLPGIIKSGLKLAKRQVNRQDTGVRENQIMAPEQVERLLSATRMVDDQQGWEGDLFRLVLVLTATGARFSQVVRMRVDDCQHHNGRLIVPLSRKGDGEKLGPPSNVPVGSDVLDELLLVTKGRDADAPLLERWRHGQAPGGVAWERTERGPWRASAEMSRPWAAIREAAGLPKAIPYALRHTSIVRGIRANLPIRLVAAMHDTSVAQIERTYSRFISDGLDELARSAVVRLVPQSNGTSESRQT